MNDFIPGDFRLGVNQFFPHPMLMYANKLKNYATDVIFSPKEAQLLFRQLQNLSTRNIAALKCESRKTKCRVPWIPLMQLSVKHNNSIKQ